MGFFTVLSSCGNRRSAKKEIRFTTNQGNLEPPGSTSASWCHAPSLTRHRSSPRFSGLATRGKTVTPAVPRGFSQRPLSAIVPDARGRASANLEQGTGRCGGRPDRPARVVSDIGRIMTSPKQPGGGSGLDRFAADRPDFVLIAPMLVYLALLALRDTLLPYEYRWLANLIRGAGGLGVVWLLRRHLPPWGKAHFVLALIAGILIAAGWYYGQYLFDYLGVPHRSPLPLFPGEAGLTDPRDKLGAGGLFWSTVVTRIVVASTTVAVVEELFWRAFLLRALIDWGKFETIPLGTFAWRSFLLTSLLSTLEHPDNWAVSIPCWFAFNALMYWKKSILFLVLVHGFTNLFLYIWVILNTVHWGNQSAWMFW